MGSLDGSITNSGCGVGGGSRTAMRIEHQFHHHGSSSGYSGGSGSSGSMSSSLEKRRRGLSSLSEHRRRLRPGGGSSGVSLKKARAAFANHSSNKELWLQLPTSTTVRRGGGAGSGGLRLVRRQRSFSGVVAGAGRSTPPNRIVTRSASAPLSPGLSSSASSSSSLMKPQHFQLPVDAPPRMIVVKQEKELPEQIGEGRQCISDANVPDLGAEQPKGGEEDEDIMSRLLVKELQQENPKMVARALERLGSIFKHESPAFCHRAVHKINGHARILESLQKWGHQDKRVARHGSHTLFRLIGTYTKNPPHQHEFNLVKALLDLGAANIIVQVLRAFPRVCDVQLYGMGALGNLFRGEECRKHAEKFVLEQKGGKGAVSVIVETMQQFPHHSKIQEFGCWLFARIAYCLQQDNSINSNVPAPAAVTTGEAHDENESESNDDDDDDDDDDQRRQVMIRRILKDEALIAVATAVRNHPNHLTIDKQAGSFMSKLFGGPQGNQKR